MKKIIMLLLVIGSLLSMLTILSKKSTSEMTTKLDANCQKSINGVIQRVERHKGFAKVVTTNDSIYFGFDEFKTHNHIVEFMSFTKIGDTIIKRKNSDTVHINGHIKYEWMIFCKNF